MTRTDSSITVHTSWSARARYRLFALAVLCMFCAADLAAQNPNLGTAGGQFLKIPAGARPAAMAGACSANIGDADALFWNPAGIMHVRSNDLSFTHTEWWATVSLNNAAFVHSLGEAGAFGISVSVVTMDKMEVTTELQPEGTGDTFDAQDLMLGVTYARNLTEDFSVGVTAKYINQRISNETATGFAFDVGTQYRIGFRDLTIAMSMTNFGSDMRYDGSDLRVKYDQNSQLTYNRLTPSDLATEDYPLPLQFQVGLAMTAFSTDDMSMMVAVDVSHPNDNNEHVNVGGELQLLDRVFLRGGYRFGYDTERATVGAGVSTPVGDLMLRFDYAYAVYDLLPGINRFSLGIQF